MASLTFGSVGDIIAICDILRNVVQALSESRGSAAEYQALVRGLQALSQAVSSTRLLLEKHPQLKENDRLRTLLQDCRDSLVQELEHIKPYRAALQSRPTASVVKALCRKIRWLAGKEERAIFRAAIASHVLALSAVLTVSGVDTQHQLYSSTVEQLQQGFGELKLASNQLNSASETQRVRLEDSVQETRVALSTRHDHSDEQALIRHAEINKKLDALHSTVSEHQGQKGDRVAIINSSNARNRVYLMLIIQLLTELASMGLIGAYHFLQVIQFMISSRALHFGPQARYLLVEDAILRQFVIDIDLMSHETFTKLIEDKFANTPGESAIALKQYFFEDKKRNRVRLDGVWSSDILKGKKVFMRASIKSISHSGNVCPACRILNEVVGTDKEISCICGCKYTTTTTILAVGPVSITRIFPGMHQQLARRAHGNNEAAKFFKRVERILLQKSSGRGELLDLLYVDETVEELRSQSKASEKHIAERNREAQLRKARAREVKIEEQAHAEWLAAAEERNKAQDKIEGELRKKLVAEWRAEQEEQRKKAMDSKDEEKEYMRQQLLRDGYTEEEIRRMMTYAGSGTIFSDEGIPPSDQGLADLIGEWRNSSGGLFEDEPMIQLPPLIQDSGDDNGTVIEEDWLNPELGRSFNNRRGQVGRE